MKNRILNLTPEEIEKIKLGFGHLLGIVSKDILECAGFSCTYLIDGKPIEEIEILTGKQLDDLLKKAVLEERYEDAAKIKKLMDNNKKL
tara:strand:- start:8457 stop:8723 length:267 start_codon:yes stop_codon:yes gene_type:complete